MSRLHFPDGKTLHSWSGYGDGHLPVTQLIPEIKISALYENTRHDIVNTDVLIIDEIGMITCKMLESVEEICRTIRDVQSPFGGIQVIAAGSFLQLPPVPSSTDKGHYAFESTNFKKFFPHKLNFSVVHRQKDMELINAINCLCEGTTSHATHIFLRGLKRPIQNIDNPVRIFSCNYDVDFFNIMMLDTLPGQEIMFTAEDIALTSNIVTCSAPKYLPLKVGCKVIIIRNLENGLVNGISAVVQEIKDESVIIRTEVDQHLQHNIQGRIFEVTRYSFMQRNSYNEVTAIRKQFPMKLGYAITVDKSQGRTIEQVIIDSTNFWRPGQLGVAVGRAKSKEGLQFLSYNEEAAMLKHPQIVQDFYSQPGYLMKQNLQCCNKMPMHGRLETQSTIGTFSVNYAAVTTNSENLNFLENIQIVDFPFDCKQYVDKLISELPKFTTS